MVSAQLLERIALSTGVTMRVRETFIEVLGRRSATAAACAELEKLLQRGEAVDQGPVGSSGSHSTGIASPSSVDAVPAPGPLPPSNRCPTCGCGRFCGSCGAQIWFMVPTAVAGAGFASPIMQPVQPVQPDANNDSPICTPDPAEADCGTMMFPMYQMGQAPYMLMPADSPAWPDA